MQTQQETITRRWVFKSANTTGASNTAMGFKIANTTGNNNKAMGFKIANTTGDNNKAVGCSWLQCFRSKHNR
tara:strand:- start:372 stop:587 length:216 start_codon:yes stop_codon:yes gene_type:complete